MTQQLFSPNDFNTYDPSFNSLGGYGASNNSNFTATSPFLGKVSNDVFLDPNNFKSLGGVGVTPTDNGIFGDILGSFKEGGAALGIAGLLGDLYSGYQKNNLAKQQLKLGKQQLATQTAFANRNLANQAQNINTRLEDRQRARIGSTGDSNVSGTQYQSLANYLPRNRIDGSPIA